MENSVKVPFSLNARLIDWIVDVNNILYAQGSTKILDHQDSDSALSFAEGYAPIEMAERILGFDIDVPPATRAEVEELKQMWLNDPYRDAWDIFRIRKFKIYANELKRFCLENRVSALPSYGSKTT